MNRIRIADEVWIAAALLHREHPEREDFRVSEIVARASREHLSGGGPLRPGVRIHAAQHCVATKPPYTARYRMLSETRRGYRRLYREGDPYHPQREGGKVAPHAADIPEAYRELLAWYSEDYAGAPDVPKADPILELRGLGRELWSDENPDDYVRRLREGWE